MPQSSDEMVSMLKQNQVKVISTDHATGLLVHWPHGGADSDVTLATVIGMGSIPTPPRCCVLRKCYKKSHGAINKIQ